MSATVLTRPTLRLAPARRTVQPPRTTPSGRLRLTRRGRLTVVVLTLVLSLAGVAFGRASSTAAADRAPQSSYRTVTVQPGQTLWQIASAADPQADPRDTIDRIVDLNGLTGASLPAGRQLALPATG